MLRVLYLFLAFLFLTSADALHLKYVSPTRVDIVTNHYIRLDVLEVCYEDVCHVKPCEPVNRVIILNSTDKWDCLRLKLTELLADGTTVRDPQDLEIRRPPPEPLHVWWMVDILVLLVACVGIFAAVKYIPEHLDHRQYFSQAQKDRHLVDKLPNVYRGSHDDHDDL